MSDEDANQAAKVAKGDIVRIDFDGWIEESNELFDTTSAKTAEENGIFKENAHYAPLPILVGGGRVFPGLEAALEGAEVGEEYDIVIPPETAAGQRDPKLVDMLPLREFLKQEVEPRVGLEVNIRNRLGYVTAVTAGRVRVDFNRRLAGKSLKYHFKVLSKVEEPQDKVKAVLEMDYGSAEGFGITVDGKNIDLVLPDVGKYDQKWTLAKYRVVADLREGLGALTVRFIEEYVKAEPASEPQEEAKEEPKAEASPEEIAEEEIAQEKQ